MGLTDGLGFEEVNQTVTSTETTSGTNVFAAGSVQAPKGLFTVTSGTNMFGAGSVQAGQFVANNNIHLAAGSPYGKGEVIQLSARGIISGGMFVIASGGKALAAPASTLHPLGIAQATVASGGTVTIQTKGLYPVVAEGAIAIGGAAMMGAGGALNTVVGVSAALAASGVRTYGVLDAVGSEGTVFILL